MGQSVMSLSGTTHSVMPGHDEIRASFRSDLALDRPPAVTPSRRRKKMRAFRRTTTLAAFCLVTASVFATTPSAMAQSPGKTMTTSSGLQITGSKAAARRPWDPHDRSGDVSVACGGGHRGRHRGRFHIFWRHGIGRFFDRPPGRVYARYQRPGALNIVVISMY